MLLPLLALGCASLQEESVDRRGRTIPWNETPAPVREEFERLHPQAKVSSTEECDEGSFYRIETPSGSILFFDKEGRFRGSII